MQGDAANAEAKYEDSLNLCKDADLRFASTSRPRRSTRISGANRQSRSYGVGDRRALYLSIPPRWALEGWPLLWTLSSPKHLPETGFWIASGWPTTQEWKSPSIEAQPHCPNIRTRGSRHTVEHTLLRVGDVAPLAAVPVESYLLSFE